MSAVRVEPQVVPADGGSGWAVRLYVHDSSGGVKLTSSHDLRAAEYLDAAREAAEVAKRVAAILGVPAVSS